MVISKLKRKIFNHIVKTKLSDKIIYATAKVEYLGVKIDPHLAASCK